MTRKTSDTLSWVLGVLCVLAVGFSLYRRSQKPSFQPPSANTRRITLLDAVQNNDVTALESVAHWQSNEDSLVIVTVGSFNGNTAVLKAVLDHNTHIMPPMLSGALVNAGTFGYLDMAQRILKYPMPTKSKEVGLAWASQNGHTQVAQEFLNANTDSNATQTLSGDTSKEITPLMRAAGHGNSEVVALLLAHHANPHLKSTEGKTALDYALHPKALPPASQASIPKRALALMQEAQKRVDYPKTIQLLKGAK